MSNFNLQPCLPPSGPHYSSYLFAQENARNELDLDSESPHDDQQAAFAGSVAHTEQALALLRQISIKAPQMAGVLDLLAQQDAGKDANTPRRLEFTEPPQRDAPVVSVLELTTGLLSNAFPQAAPLFHSCRAFLHLKLLKKKAG